VFARAAREGCEQRSEGTPFPRSRAASGPHPGKLRQEFAEARASSRDASGARPGAGAKLVRAGTLMRIILVG
jgi:hypothetical protein